MKKPSSKNQLKDFHFILLQVIINDFMNFETDITLTDKCIREEVAAGART